MHSLKPPKPPCPPPCAPHQGYLMQRIVACEKRSIPCLGTEWCFDACTHGCIQRVSPCGAPVWHVKDDCTLQITVPVSVQLCDACGHLCVQNASLELETTLSRQMLCQLDDPGVMLLILPRIRLARAENICGACFRVQLAVWLDLYLLRYETLHCAAPKPPCPQLPLYPPPMC